MHSSLAENRIREIIILNGHHAGNRGSTPVHSSGDTGQDTSYVNIQILHYWQMMTPEFDHAGEVETSLVLVIAPELVHMDRAMPNSKDLSKSRASFITASQNAPGSFPKITGNGVLGRPT